MATKNATATELDSLSKAALDSYLSDGETAGLLALADKLQDEQQKFWAEDAEALTIIASTDSEIGEAVRFFARNAGWCGRIPEHNATAEKLRSAARLAHAELWYEIRTGSDLDPEPGELRIHWEDDNEFTEMDGADYGEYYSVEECILSVYTDDDEWEILQSLHGITFNDDYLATNIYKRVVAAELCEQELAEREPKK